MPKCASTALLVLLVMLGTPPGGLSQGRLTVTNHLVLWLKADAGVQTNRLGQVVRWVDQSQSQHQAQGTSDGSQEESPFFVADAWRGKPAIRFDGMDDVLEITPSPHLLPADSSWSVFFVAKQLDGSRGDFPQIIGSRAWTSARDKGWAISMDRSGLIAAHYADGNRGHDVLEIRSMASLSKESFQVWQVEENRKEGFTAFYLMGDLDRKIHSGMPSERIDQAEPIHIGREIGGLNNRRANIELAEVLIYRTGLSKEEREAITAYLCNQYGWSFVPNLHPTISITSPNDGVTLDVPHFLLRTAAADSDGQIKKVVFYHGNHVLATAVFSPFSAYFRFLSPGKIRLTAEAIDDRGARAMSAPLAVSYRSTNNFDAELSVTNGLALWLKADAGVTTNDFGQVIHWTDQSVHRHKAAKRSMATEVELPRWIPSASNHKPALFFDGEDDVLEIANHPSLQTLERDWTVILVVKKRHDSQGDYPQILGSRAWTAAYDKGWAISFDQVGLVVSHLADGTNGHDVTETRSGSPASSESFEIWEVQESRSEGITSFYAGGHIDRALKTKMPSGVVDQSEPIFIGRAIGGLYNRAASMELAEILIYNRLLSGRERDAVNQYLGFKYGVTAVRLENDLPTVSLKTPRPEIKVREGHPITLLAAASDKDGSVSAVDFYLGTNKLGSVSAAPFSLTISNCPRGKLIFTAQAMDNLGAIGASAPVTVTVTPVFWRTWWFSSASAFLIAWCMAAGARFASTRKVRRKMRLLQEQHALEKERTRIAQDIHDDLGASLTQIGMLSELAKRDADHPLEVAKHADRISERTRQVVAALDEIVWAVNPKNDSLGRLVAYILQYSEQFFDSASMAFRFDVPESVPDLPISAELRHNLFLAVKEALNNVCKHSAASEVCLRVMLEDSKLVICVQDNGRGFSSEVWSAQQNGLESMRKRLACIGGRFDLETQPQYGTRVTLFAPLWR